MKKRTKYVIDQKEFDTFKKMKEYVWYNSHTNEEKQGFEMINDEIQKHYIFVKKERRLLCNTIYDKKKIYEEWLDHIQLKLFENE